MIASLSSLIFVHKFSIENCVPRMCVRYLWTHSAPVTKGLVGNSNNPASRSWSSVTSLLAFLVPAFAQIIGASVDDEGALYDHVSTEKE
jgi:hypothetical protein